MTTVTNALTMGDLIARFKQWTADCPLDIAFNAGADGAAIAAAEAEMGRRLPDDLREYLLAADGEAWNSDGLIGNWGRMPTRRRPPSRACGGIQAGSPSSPVAVVT